MQAQSRNFLVEAPIGMEREKHRSEPMICRLARENAEAIRGMGRDAILEAHAAGVDAHYRDLSSSEGMVRESPDGVRHLERKVDGEWVEVATFPPSPKWRKP